MIAILIAVVLVLAVVAVVSSPWRARRRGRTEESAELTAARGEVVELSATRDAKYREIRDAELDHQTGKLSDVDFAAVDDTLRREAIAVLKRLDRAQARVERLATRELEATVAPGDAEPGDETESTSADSSYHPQSQ